MVALGGRAAEIIYTSNRVTTGASSDYAKVYQIAREMVTTYGFGKNNFDYRNLSPTDGYQGGPEEIETIVSRCYDYTLKMLQNNRDKLEQLKDLLIEEEIVDGEKVYELLGKDRCYAYDCSVSFD